MAESDKEILLETLKAGIDNFTLRDEEESDVVSISGLLLGDKVTSLFYKPDFELLIDEPEKQKAFIEAARSYGVILTAKNGKIRITDKQYAVLAKKLNDEALPTDAAKMHVKLRGIYNKKLGEGYHCQFLSDSFTGEVKQDATSSQQPFVSLKLNEGVNKGLLLRNLREFLSVDSAKLSADGTSLLLSAEDWHRLSTLNKDILFSGSSKSESLNGLLSKFKSPQNALMTTVTDELRNRIYTKNDDGKINFVKGSQLKIVGAVTLSDKYLKTGNLIAIDCGTSQQADYYRDILDIENEWPDKVLYLDEVQFNALFQEKEGVTFSDIQSSFFDPKHPEIVPVKRAIQAGQLKNENSGFSLTISDHTLRQDLIRAAKHLGVSLKVTDDNKIMISDKQYNKLAAKFSDEKLSFFPPKAAQAHANVNLLLNKDKKISANPLKLSKDKKNTHVPAGYGKKQSEKISFKKDSNEKSADQQVMTEKLAKLDAWISQDPTQRSKTTGTAGSPFAPTVKINDPTDPAKSRQFVYDAQNGMVLAKNENCRPEIYQAMLKVLDVGDDPVVDVNISFNSKATPAEKAASLTVAAEAFAAALNANLLPLIDECCPFTQNQIIGKLNETDKAKYDFLNNEVKTNKTLSQKQQAKLIAAEVRKPLVPTDENIEKTKVLAQDELEKRDFSSGISKNF